MDPWHSFVFVSVGEAICLKYWRKLW